LLNAVAHRDYRHPGSIFVRQYSRRLEVVSPGGFPTGITAENILYRQNPRNRRLADTFARCGLVDRAGQGADRLFEEAIRQGKPLPDFTHTDAYQVSLTLHGAVQDEAFLQFLQRMTGENIAALSMEELLVLDSVRRNVRVSAELRPSLRKFLDMGAIVSMGRGSGTRHVFSRRLYAESNMRMHPHDRWLDRAGQKARLLDHVRSKGTLGTKFEELQQALPRVGRIQIQRLMRELRRERLIESQGTTKATRSFLVPSGRNSEAK
jgi:ATP-dependent DNA helicase RecG